MSDNEEERKRNRDALLGEGSQESTDFPKKTVALAPKENGLISSIAVGGVLGLIISGICLGLITNVFYEYYSYERDGMAQTRDGGFITSIILYFGFIYWNTPKEIKEMKFLPGLGFALAAGCAGWILPLFVWGVPGVALSILDWFLNFLGGNDILGGIFNSLFDLVGGFCMGGMAIGIAGGVYYYNNQDTLHR